VGFLYIFLIGLIKIKEFWAEGLSKFNQKLDAPQNGVKTTQTNIG
jgi:hypothetical protein